MEATVLHRLLSGGRCFGASSCLRHGDAV
jgi:hypothetical protein